MRQRIFLMAAVAASLALTACGGGGSVPSPGSPTASPAPFNVVFSGTKNVQATYAYPAASPYPNENLTSQINESTTITSPVSQTTYYQTTETEALPNVTHTYTTQEEVAQTAGTGNLQNLVVGGINYSDDSKDSQQVRYSPALIVDEQPESNGLTWSNTAALTANEKYADGTTIARTQNADGSYSDAMVSPDGTNATITLNSDGSGGIATPSTSPALYGGAVVSYSFSAPSAAPSAGGKITVAIDFSPAYAASYNITPNPFLETGNAWFAPISATNPLYSDSTSVTTAAAFPASCNVPSAYGTTGNDVRRTIQSIDPILGYEEVTQTDAYVDPTVGPVCVALQDSVLTFYDWQGTNTFGSHNFTSGQPLQITNTTQTLTLQSGSGAGIQGLLSLAPAAIAGAEANFNASISAVHMKRTAQFLQYIRTLSTNGGRPQ